jgi:hypothetical protein
VTKHGQRQHRITEWYLQPFAHAAKGGPELDYYETGNAILPSPTDGALW